MVSVIAIPPELSGPLIIVILIQRLEIIKKVDLKAKKSKVVGFSIFPIA